MTTKPKTMQTRKPAAKAYEAFVTAILEPLPDHELTDAHYNGLVRQSRYDAWQRADAVTCYHRAAMDFYSARWRYYGTVESNPTLADDSKNRMFETADKYRAAIALQILTPSYNQVGVIHASVGVSRSVQENDITY